MSFRCAVMILLNFDSFVSPVILMLSAIDLMFEASVGASHATNLIFLICDLKTITCLTEEDFKKVRCQRIAYKILISFWILVTLGVTVFLGFTNDYELVMLCAGSMFLFLSAFLIYLNFKLSKQLNAVVGGNSDFANEQFR